MSALAHSPEHVTLHSRALQTETKNAAVPALQPLAKEGMAGDAHPPMCGKTRPIRPSTEYGRAPERWAPLMPLSHASVQGWGIETRVIEACGEKSLKQRTKLA